MNGAESLVRTLLAAGVDTCFANPGTSEMHFVAALDQVPGMKCVLGLQENVVTGMADGYFRIARKPACTLLHCGPGFANGMANLHNARRARSGIVNIVGDQATHHRPLDAPLTSDIDAMARTVSGWVRTSLQSGELGRDAVEAVAAARSFPGQVATLILPADVSWADGGVVGAPAGRQMPAAIDGNAIEGAARLLRQQGEVLILLAGDGVRADAQRFAWSIAKATGSMLLAEFVNPCVARGRGRAQINRVPYARQEALAVFRRFKHIILVGARPPVAFFAYPGEPSTQYETGTQFHVLSRPDQDPLAALEALAQALKVDDAEMPDPGRRPEPASGTPTPEGLAQTVSALMPENAIISEESATYGRHFYQFTHSAPAHDWLHLTGGAIGDGMPVATGAAIAAHGQRRVINLQADGSALYTVQALWTQSRERLPVTTIIINNGKYNILIGEYTKVGAGTKPGSTAMSMLDLGDPALQWVQIANGMGVEAARAHTLEECADLMRSSLSRSGPFLIELMV